MDTSNAPTAAAIYCRISMDRTGEGAGVQRQETECRALADKLGYDVGAVYIDNDVSATSGARRPEFERMLADRPATIITWAQDRLLRLSSDLEKVIALNIPVHMVTAGTLDLATDAGQAVARTVAAWSTYETAQKGRRQRAANDQRALSGIAWATVGYGYRRNAARAVEVVPHEAQVVREAVGRLLAGDSLRSIARDFNERGLASPSRTASGWNGTTLRQMVLRKSLAGLRVHRGVVVGAGQWEPIISTDEHDRLTATLNDPARKSNYSGREPKYLLTGLAICGKCGQKMKRAPGRMTTTKRGGRKRQPPAYACFHCYGVRRKQEPVDDLVTSALLARLMQPDALDVLHQGDESAAKATRDALAAIDARLTNAADAYSAGAIELAQLTRITAQLRSDQTAQEAALKRFMPAAIPADIAGDHAPERWQSLSIDAQRLLLSALIRVTIHPSGPGRNFDPELVQIEWLHN